MQILHVIGSLDPAQGGPSSVAVAITGAQILRGDSVTVLSQAESDLARAEAGLTKASAGIPGFERVQRCTVPAITGKLAMLWPKPDATVRQLVRAADVLHIHGAWEPVLAQAAQAAAELGKPTVLTPHGMLDTWALARKPLKKKIALNLAYGRMIRGAGAIQALSEHERECIVAGKFNRRTEIVPNGVFLEQIDPLPARGAFRAAHPELGQDPYVLFLARLHPGKGLSIIAEAVAEALRSYPALRWVVAGPDHGAQQALVLQLARLGIAERVHLVGPIYDRAKFAAMVDAACFMLPSEHEGFSMSIVEAMACGVPVIISPECHFSQLAASDAGLIVPRTGAANAQALISVLRNPHEAATRASRARRLVEERYTWSAVASQLGALYKSLAAGRARPT